MHQNSDSRADKEWNALTMEGCTRHAVKVFIPQCYLKSKSGLLLGWKNTEERSTCYTVAAVVENQLDMGLIEQKLALSNLKHPPQLVGVIIDMNSKTKDEILRTMKNSFMISEWIALERTDTKEPGVTLMGHDVSGEMTCDDVLVVAYDAREMMSSVYLMDNACRCINYNQHPAEQTNNLDIITESLARYRYLKQHLNNTKTVVDFKLSDSLHAQISPLRWMLKLIEKILVAIFYALVSIVTLCNKGILLRWPHFICNAPAVCSQLKRRFDQIKIVVDLQKGSPLQRHRSRNLLCLHVFDVCLGVLLMVWLLTDNRAEKFSTQMMEWAEHVAAYLQNLLQWMMGSPAGLKLNRQLTKLLGKFFTYHIYLWTGYLSVLRPVQVSILWVIATSGALGISVQLALMRDLVSMMTLHIYCFYVYAARLYRLQMYALSSLWRLFRGKKWNVLRQRMDSATFDIDQLFIGTLFFTILLFLLPTTALYYLVFTALRLVVLSIQGAFYWVISVINVLPVAAIFSRVVFRSTVSDRVKFSLIPRMSGRPLYLSMKTQAASFMTIMTSLSQYDVKRRRESWGSFVKKLFIGDLVYPWIEPPKDKTE